MAATAIILAHNHPSGNLKPSNTDETITAKIKEGARLLDVHLSDHIIISSKDNEYFSFADSGMI